MDILGKIFGSEKIIEGAMNGIDSIVYTDEEKANTDILKRQLHIETLKTYSAFKITQRVLAILFAVLFAITFIISLILTINGVDTQPIIQLASKFWLGEIVLTIVAFYFGGGAIDSIKRKTT
jgi:hypothetical protein